MKTKIFRWTFMAFMIVMALVVGGAWYQTITIVPFWQQDISMFKNYGHWGIDYFPILSPLMTVLWLAVLIIGFKIKLPNKTILYIAHVLFLVIMACTFIYFAPFLLNNMGHPQNNISDQELKAVLNTWAKWDFIRQVAGLVMLILFMYSYSQIELVEDDQSR